MSEEAQKPNESEFGFGFIYIFGFAFLLLIFVMMPQVRGWLKLGGFRWIYIPSVSLLVAFLVTPLIRLIAFHLKAIDVPDARKTHLNPTPLLGGIAVFTGYAFSMFVNNLYSRELMGVFIASTLILVLGMWDDIRGLSARVKILGQLVASALVIYFGVRLSFLPPGLTGDIIEVLLTFVWLIGISNALNFLDGMDGLATGLGAISSFFIGLVALQTNQPFLMFISLGLLGGCLGFLPYNMRANRPAAIFLGDAGSTFIGFTLASLGVMGEWDTSDPIKAFAMPLLILGVMIFDMTFITIGRVVSGQVNSIRQWIEYVGRDHIHHKLNDLGLSPRQTVFFICLIASSLGISAIVLRDGRTVDAFLLIIQSFNIFFLLVILMQKAANRRD
ncbi:MAG: MraY family glycosyltransferase [bacterium]